MEIAMAKGETFIRSFLSLPDEPETAFFWCDGCRAEITFASEIWTCLSESGSIQLDDKCYKKLKREGWDLCVVRNMNTIGCRSEMWRRLMRCQWALSS
ncbi:hypothetical protein FOIG_01653 [Fusarium odoratissimum NRRL 54006]|uniref:Uncharacterized protein n=2 Tax=Fusarium oxysporum species complex TaxID=171631 RepID=X0K520_FUSO5|nr:uncharacterized protein FOIG_01653 [Fusarium odoratissimum NRRL 54006]EXM08573.1 hypothetical protein FOIG_01653 [Fusarium odoratissimum NRRL 54006]TXC05521.1 hypothetical protein FocTR4_00009545 [Fusarium oxysporum f. sp. cubense]